MPRTATDRPRVEQVCQDVSDISQLRVAPRFRRQEETGRIKSESKRFAEVGTQVWIEARQPLYTIGMVSMLTVGARAQKNHSIATTAGSSAASADDLD